MILFSVLLFLIVLFISWLVYLFCKRVIYKLNRRVLARNMAIIKNGQYLKRFEELDEKTIREKLILPFFMVLGYNTYDMREFSHIVNRASFYPDYAIKKYDNSSLVKNAFAIKFLPFTEEAVDINNLVFDEKAANCVLDELMDKLYFKSDYYILTNGYMYVFFSKKRRLHSNNFEFCFNIKNFSKQDAAKLAYYTKQYVFLQISDVYRA